MTESTLPLIELLQKHDDGDFLRAVTEAVLQLLMEHDVEGVVGAGRYERGDGRQNWRNGYRARELKTRLGALNLRGPRLRQGSYFPGLLEPHRTSEKALVAVIQEAWIGGVSTRRVDDLVQAMGLTGISKSTGSKLCKDIDERVREFFDRPIAADWPYLWLDATYLKVRQRGRIISVAAIIAMAVIPSTQLESEPNVSGNPRRFTRLGKCSRFRSSAELARSRAGQRIISPLGPLAFARLAFPRDWGRAELGSPGL